MRSNLVIIVVLATSLSCTGPAGSEGPMGEGLASLSDPEIMPTVIYTNPANNATGRLADFTNLVAVRLN